MVKIIDKYAKFISHNPWKVLIFSLIITAIFFYGLSIMETKNMDYQGMLPKDIDEIKTFNIIDDEFGGVNSVIIVVKLNDKQTGIHDILEPEVLQSIDLLEQKLLRVDKVEQATSIVDYIKKANEGYNARTLGEAKIFAVSSPLASNYVSGDYSMTVIRLSVNGDVDAADLEKDLTKVLDESSFPEGVNVRLAGDLITDPIVERLIGPDMSRTSMFSMIGIVIILFLLFRSVKNSLMPLATILFGTIWAMGFASLTGFELSTMTSGVISMILGIGIDFGIQVMSRFNQERKKENANKAMEITLSNVTLPLLTTTLAALIGFRAMSLGQLQLMGEIGTVMSIGITACMIASVTIVPAILVLLSGKTKKKVFVKSSIQRFKSKNLGKKSMKSKNFVLMSAVFVLLVATLSVNVLADTYSVSLQSYSPNPAESGKSFHVTFNVKNLASTDKSDVSFEIDESDPFSIDSDDDDEIDLGTLKAGQETSVSFDVQVDENAEEDDYKLEYKIKDSSDSEKGYEYISVVSKNVKLAVGDVKSEPLKIVPDTKNVKLTVKLQNLGSEMAKAVKIRLKLPEGFKASTAYSDRANFGSIAGNGDVSAVFYIDVDKEIVSDSYTGTIEVEYEEDGKTKIKNLDLDLPVYETPMLEIVSVSSDKPIVQGSDVTLKVKVLNSGDDGDDVSFRVFKKSEQPFEFEEKSDYIGNLKSGESGEGIIKFSVDSDAAVKSYVLQFELRSVKDGNVITKTASYPIQVEKKEGLGSNILIIGVLVMLGLVGTFGYLRYKRKNSMLVE